MAYLPLRRKMFSTLGYYCPPFTKTEHFLEQEQWGECYDWLKQLNIFPFFFRRKLNIFLVNPRYTSLVLRANNNNDKTQCRCCCWWGGPVESVLFSVFNIWRIYVIYPFWVVYQTFRLHLTEIAGYLSLWFLSDLLQSMKATYAVTVDDIHCAFFDQVEKLRDFGGRNKENISMLLWGFFNYWAYCHDYANHVISVRAGCILRWDLVIRFIVWNW